ncbi:MAG: S46 family peptidase [bacterium]|jgi:hypothetical protein
MRFRLIVILIVIQIITRWPAFAGEGMWIPMLLEQLNEKEMQEMGMKISAEDIYSINQSSMKDGIVLFGRGCTAEIISEQGLLLTNYHCGFSQIQKHSSVEHDYLTNGFWAMSGEEELPNPGLTATMMVEMREVTEQVLDGVTEEMTESERNSMIRNNAGSIIADFEEESEYQAFIRPFFSGNAYYMIIVEIFRDIRLVGAPPSNIGKFGGDTDNWMWPRHTGDFSLFRIYVGPDGKPADYAEENVPYRPKYHFPISTGGVEQGDFTFVFGYPARTSEYLPSDAIEMIIEEQNPGKIELRETRLDIFNKYSNMDPKVRIQYASKHARVSNYWKKMIGESAGIHRMNGISRKVAYEEEFSNWANSSPEWKEKYGELLPAFEETYALLTPLNVTYDYYREAVLAVEIVNYARSFRKLIELSENNDPLLPEEVEKLKTRTTAFFKDYYRPIDAEVMSSLFQIYYRDIGPSFHPEFLEKVDSKYDGNWEAFTREVFEKSFLDDEQEVLVFLDEYKSKHSRKLEKDPVYEIYQAFESIYLERVRPDLSELNARLDSLQRIYMAAQMEMQPEERFYPDANFTLRVTYGNVDGYRPSDAVKYRYYTTLEGIMEKENPDIYDYVVEDKLKALYQARDYGKYAAEDGTMRVAFVATNHTTGGNSGSPVLNAEGQLVGVNFDRCWEGTMSDLMYDPDVCRNISLDIRYFLFIVDKFAGAGYLVDEMDIVSD